MSPCPSSPSWARGADRAKALAKILHILAERAWSGGEMQLEALVHFLAEKGHKQIFALQPGAQFEKVPRALGLRVLEQRMRNDLSLGALRGLRNIVKAEAQDLLHFACSRSHKLGGVASIGLSPVKVVTRRMDYALRPNPWKRWLYCKAVDGVVCVSAAVQGEVLGLGVPPSRARLVHDGVDSARFAGLAFSDRRRAARTALGLDPQAFVGLTTASLHRRKGQDILLQALALLAPRLSIRKLQWVFAGEGPQGDALRAQAASLPGSIEVLFPGRVSRIEDLLAASDLFCLPSRREGLGVALLEAMAAGLPVIASKVGGMIEAFEDPESGRHVPPEDPASLAEAILSLETDPEKARAMGRRAAERCRESFDLRRMCRDTEAFYLELLAGSQASNHDGEAI